MNSCLFALIGFSFSIWFFLRHSVDRSLNVWMDRKIADLSTFLDRQFVFVSPATLSRTLRLFLLILTFFACLSRDFTWMLMGLGSMFLFYASIQKIERFRQKRFERQFHSWVSTFASMIRSGQAIENALEASLQFQKPPLSQELALVLKETALGHSLENALRQLLQRQPGKDAELFVETVVLSLRNGSELTPVLQSFLEVIRRRKVLESRLDAMTLQGRAQAWIGIAIPVFIFISVQWISPGYFTPLTQHEHGNLILWTLAGALLLGTFWIQRLARPIRL